MHTVPAFSAALLYPAGNAGQANYAAAKAAIVGLTKTVAKEWGHVNIRCNAIAYGMIDTRLTRAKEGGEAISIAGEKVSSSSAMCTLPRQLL